MQVPNLTETNDMSSPVDTEVIAAVDSPVEETVEEPIVVNDSVQMFQDEDYFRSTASVEDRIPLTPFGVSQEQTIREAEAVQKAEYENAYSKIRDVVSAVVPTETGGAVAAFTLDVFAEGAEDVLNAGLDASEAILKMFNDDVSVENIDYITKTLPDSNLQSAARTMIQLMGGYGMAVKGARAAGALSKSDTLTKGMVKAKDNAIKLGAVLTSESVFNNLSEKMFSQEMAEKVPFFGDLVRYIDEDVVGESKALQRLQMGVYGVLEGAAADAFIKMVKAFKVAKKTKDALPKTPDQMPLTPEETLKTVEQTALTRAEQAEFGRMRDRSMTYNENGKLTTRAIDPNSPPEIPEHILLETRAAGDYNPNRVLTIDSEGRRVAKNLTTIDAPDDIRLAIGDMMQRNPEMFGKDAITYDRIRDAASNLNMTADDLVKWTESQGLELGQVLGARALEVEAADQLKEIARGVRSGQTSMEDFAVAYENFKMISSTVGDMQSLSSALFREGAIPVRPGANPSKELYDILDQGERLRAQYGDKVLGRIAKHLEMATLKDMKNASQHSIARGYNLFTQLKMGGMLSAPNLLIRNTISSIQNLTLELAESTVASGIGSARLMSQNIYSHLLGKPKVDQIKIDWTENVLQAHGMFQGISEAIQISAKQFSNKVSGGRVFDDIMDTEFLGVRAGKTKISDSYVMEGSPESNLFMRTIKGAIGLPAKAVRWQDDFTKHVAMRMKLNQEAYRVAAGEVRNGAGVNNAVRRAEIMEKLALDKQTIDRLSDFGEQITFTNAPNTQLGKNIVELTDPSRGPLGKLMFQLAPFARANVNAITYTFDRVPFANLILKRNRDIMFGANVDPRIRDLYLARQVTMSTGLATTAYFLNSQDMLNAPRPKADGRLYDMGGKQGPSITIGDKEISFLPETPMGAMLAGIALLNQIGDVVQDQNPQLMQDVATLVSMAMMETFSPEFIAQAPAEFLRALTEGDVGILEGLAKVGTDVSTQYIPYSSFARRYNRTGEGEGQFVRDTNPGPILPNFFEGIFNEVLAVYAPEKLPARRDFFGNKMKHKQGFGGLLSPLNASTVSSDPVMREMVRLADNTNKNLSKAREVKVDNLRILDQDYELFRAPSRTVVIESGVPAVKLNNNEYERLSLLSAGIDPETEKPIRAGMDYRSNMEKLIKSDGYKKAPFDLQQRMAGELHRTFLALGQQMYVQRTYSPETLREGLKQFFDKYSQ